MSSAAALQLHPRLQPTTGPPGPGSPRRPPLRAIEGGRAPSRMAQRAVYRRRRLAVALAVVVAATLLLLAGAALAGAAGGGHPTAAGTSSDEVHVVQPGETLWSIAGEIAPDGDVRLVVDRLVDLNGGSRLVVGQRLRLA